MYFRYLEQNVSFTANPFYQLFYLLFAEMGNSSAKTAEEFSLIILFFCWNVKYLPGFNERNVISVTTDSAPNKGKNIYFQINYVRKKWCKSQAYKLI